MQKTTCSKCGEPNDRAGRQRYCRRCHAAYMRERRDPYSALSPEEKRRSSARSKLHMAVKRGWVAKRPCEVCGSIDVEGHHEDYARPLDVYWLCPEHHRRLHRMLKAYPTTRAIIDALRFAHVVPNSKPESVVAPPALET